MCLSFTRGQGTDWGVKKPLDSSSLFNKQTGTFPSGLYLLSPVLLTSSPVPQQHPLTLSLLI